jgi:hypothetical protein
MLFLLEYNHKSLAIKFHGVLRNKRGVNPKLLKEYKTLTPIFTKKTNPSQISAAVTQFLSTSLRGISFQDRHFLLKQLVQLEFVLEC